MAPTSGLAARALAHVDRLRGRLQAVADRVWEYAELGLQEVKSSAAQQEELRAHGFAIEAGVAGMPTAFVAGYTVAGGGPCIGFLGEFDALPGLSQERVPVRRPRQEGAPGHGCGHNLLGTAAMGAAIALRYALEEAGVPATVQYFGCPAEETLVGKTFMVAHGLFDGVDAAITWHPGDLNTVWTGSSNAVNSVKFRFSGKTAHAAADPHRGRSALDAVELMNVGTNYLREHMPPDARIHYSITDGGGQPNVVPATAEVWYYVRAPRRDQVEELYARVVDCARGAALMTGTSFEIEFLAACYNLLPNAVMEEVLFEALEAVGPPAFDDADRAFAAKLAESIPPEQKAEALRNAKAPPDLFDAVLHERVDRPFDPGRLMHGSTEVADVSWVTPTGQITTACVPLGAPGHSWQWTASVGSSVGAKGMLTATKAMALAGLRLITDRDALARARAEFRERTRDGGYKSPLPEGARPPIGRLPARG